MAANNNNNANGGGRQVNEHVEFSVRAEEDLYLQGTETTIRRVTAETNYSCLMLKTQRFSSLFRHYAKYHGLRKDELEYYFVNLLGNDDTPESVQLQRGDTIMVRKRRKPEPVKIAADDKEYFKDMQDLLRDTEHMDAVFVIHGNNNNNNNTARIQAHRSILTARADYFKALFRKRQFRESSECTVTVDPPFSEEHIRAVLEFIYTNSMSKFHRNMNTDDLLTLLVLADQWLLESFKKVLEKELIKHISVTSVARLYIAAEDSTSNVLKESCQEFIKTHLKELAGHPSFEQDMRRIPDLCLPILHAAADLVSKNSKLANTTTNNVTTLPASKKQRTSSSTAVPDTETSFPMS